MSKLHLAFAGRIRAGKSTIIDLLTLYLKATDVPTRFHRTSDPLNEFLDRWSLSRSRDNQQKLSRDVREIFGEDTIANAVKQRVLHDTAQVVFIDGFRRLADLAMLKDLGGQLIFIDAVPWVRWHRSLTALDARVGDKEMTFEEFLERDNAESEQLIAELGRHADYTIDNSGTTLELDGQVKNLIEKLGL
jgi:dephospho-CoA kinase